MRPDTSGLPVVLVVGFPNSVHTASWINCIRRRGYRIVLFPSVMQKRCLELDPLREVRTRSDLDALKDGEIGLYPKDELDGLTEEEREDPAVYPFVKPAFTIPASLLPKPASLCKAIRAFGPDLIHSLELQHGSYLALEARKEYEGNFPPWLASAWGSDIFLYRRFPEHRRLLIRLFKEVDALHSDCARDIEWARKAGFGGFAFPQMPASGGVDFNRFPDLSSLPPPSERKTLLVKGYHHWAGRGLHILLALHLIAPHLRDFSIRVTHCGSAMKDMAEKLAHYDNLDITVDPHLPSHADALARLASARVAIGYGISDGISTTLLEAMAVGTFMIQANTCCGKEWVTNGQTGLIVPPHDTVALSKAILNAIQNDGLVDSAVAVNRRVVEARWNARTNGERIAEGYRTIIDQGRHA